MRFDVLTLFPEAFQGFLAQSVLKRAIDAGVVDVRLHNIRDWAKDKHHSVDDRPFGGGPGMVLKVEPVVDCAESVRRQAADPGHLVMLTPQGRRLRQPDVERLAENKRILLLCGRYEGFDERIREILNPEEISLGDFVLCGGEVAAMAVIEACVRLLPAVLGNDSSAREESFSAAQGGLLEYPHYTRPAVFRGWAVPEVLCSGDHAAVARWRREQALRRTRERRPDLLGQTSLTRQDKEFLARLETEAGKE